MLVDCPAVFGFDGRCLSQPKLSVTFGRGVPREALARFVLALRGVPDVVALAESLVVVDGGTDVSTHDELTRLFRPPLISAPFASAVERAWLNARKHPLRRAPLTLPLEEVISLALEQRGQYAFELWCSGDMGCCVWPANDEDVFDLTFIEWVYLVDCDSLCLEVYSCNSLPKTGPSQDLSRPNTARGPSDFLRHVRHIVPMLLSVPLHDMYEHETEWAAMVEFLSPASTE